MPLASSGNASSMLLCRPDHVVDVGRGEPGRDHRPPVAALRAVAVVSEARHQHRPRVGDRAVRPNPVRPSGPTIRSRAATAPPRGSPRVAARSRRGTPRPIPGQPCVMINGNASGSSERAWMKWICWPSISVRKCGQRLNRSSCAAPVELRAPVLAEVLEVREVGAVAPTRARDLVGPAGASQPVAEVVEHRVGNVDSERSDVVVGHRRDATAAVPQPAAAEADTAAADRLRRRRVPSSGRGRRAGSRRRRRT